MRKYQNLTNPLEAATDTMRFSTSEHSQYGRFVTFEIREGRMFEVKLTDSASVTIAYLRFAPNGNAFKFASGTLVNKQCESAFVSFLDTVEAAILQETEGQLPADLYNENKAAFVKAIDRAIDSFINRNDYPEIYG